MTDSEHHPESVYFSTRVTVYGKDVGSAGDYRAAMSGEGPKAGDWSDKPHRLIYDLCCSLVDRDKEIQRLKAITVQREGDT